MEYRLLGKTGLRISEIGFGCGNTGGLLTGGTYEEQRSAIERALAVGINYFDTAPNYGERVYVRGKSEDNLGTVLRDLGARPLVGTKIELQAEHLADIPGAVAQSVDESLERLGRDATDILYLHNRVGRERTPGMNTAGTGVPLTLDEVLGPRGVLEAFAQQRTERKVRYLGFCSTGGTCAANRALVESGGFDCVQLIYNILDPTEGRLPPTGYDGPDHSQTIALAGEHGLGVVVIRVLAGGVLSGAPEPHALNTGSAVQREYGRGVARAGALRFLDRPGQHTRTQAAIRFALGQPAVSTVLVGFSARAQIDEAIMASGAGLLAPDDLDQIEQLYTTALFQEG